MVLFCTKFHIVFNIQNQHCYTNKFKDDKMDNILLGKIILTYLIKNKRHLNTSRRYTTFEYQDIYLPIPLLDLDSF